ncbi:hypothetical protein Tco_1034978 [Tanacetum coccineum]
MERITIKEYELESEVFDLLKIDLDLFTYDTPLGTIFDEFRLLSSMEEDLFAYELGVLEDFYFPTVIQFDDRLVKLIDITLEQWLNLKFGDHKKVDKEIIEKVVSTWLVRSYRKQFTEYMEIKRRLEVNGINTNVECDPTNVEFPKWGDDEEVMTEDELSNLEEEDLRFKTYSDYKNAWIYEWNKEVSWVEEKPWLDDGTWEEPNDDICHDCNPFQFKRLEDGDLKDEALKEKAILEGSWGHVNRKGNNFCSWLKECFGNYHELDYKLMMKLEEYRRGKKEKEESSEDAWSNYSSNDGNDAIHADQERFDNHDPMEDDDDDIEDLDDYLIPQDASYYVDEEEERFKERKSKLLGIPYKKPPTFKSEKFEV